MYPEGGGGNFSLTVYNSTSPYSNHDYFENNSFWYATNIDGVESERLGYASCVPLHFTSWNSLSIDITSNKDCVYWIGGTVVQDSEQKADMGSSAYTFTFHCEDNSPNNRIVIMDEFYNRSDCSIYFLPITDFPEGIEAKLFQNGNDISELCSRSLSNYFSKPGCWIPTIYLNTGEENLIDLTAPFTCVLYLNGVKVSLDYDSSYYDIVYDDPTYGTDTIAVTPKILNSTDQFARLIYVSNN